VSPTADAEAVFEGTPPSLAGFRELGLFILAWGLSILPILLPERAALSLGDSSRLALVWIPWVALIGWPAPAEGARNTRRSWPLALGLALPVTALAAWIDARSGLGRGALEATYLGAALSAILLGEARYQAARGGLAIYAPLWFVTVAGLPALAASISWGVRGELGTSGLAPWLASVAPLGALWENVHPDHSPWHAALFCPSTLLCVVICATMTAARQARKGAGL